MIDDDVRQVRQRLWRRRDDTPFAAAYVLRPLIRSRSMGTSSNDVTNRTLLLQRSRPVGEA